jgi:hypothetical protein
MLLFCPGGGDPAKPYTQDVFTPVDVAHTLLQALQQVLGSDWQPVVCRAVEQDLVSPCFVCLSYA